MKLSERLRTTPTTGTPNAGGPVAGPPPWSPPVPAPVATETTTVVMQPTDPFVKLKERAQEALFARLGARLFDASMSEQQLHAFVMQELSEILESERTPLTADERQQLVADMSDDVLGLGPVEAFLADDSVTEVMANSTTSIYVERNGRLELTSSRFLSDTHLRRVIERIVTKVGRRIDESSPMVDARLPDGSRINAIIPPLAVDGPVLTVRKFRREAYTGADLVENGTFSPLIADVLDACVRGRLNILVTGGTGTGKTTLLNVLSTYLPSDQRIVTIEDAVELRLQQPHVIRLESRPPNIEGKGEVAIRDLVRNALRMRPDRIVVGEVRGGEALDMLQAMNTGHEGSLCSLHANSPRDGLNRLETMVLMAGLDLPLRAIREQVASAIDVIVHISRLRDGCRRVTRICEVNGLEGDVVTMTDLFTYNWHAVQLDDGTELGAIEPTGIRPQFADKLHDLGIVLAPELFGGHEWASIR